MVFGRYISRREMVRIFHLPTREDFDLMKSDTIIELTKRTKQSYINDAVFRDKKHLSHDPYHNLCIDVINLLKNELFVSDNGIKYPVFEVLPKSDIEKYLFDAGMENNDFVTLNNYPFGIIYGVVIDQMSTIDNIGHCVRDRPADFRLYAIVYP